MGRKSVSKLIHSLIQYQPLLALTSLLTFICSILKNLFSCMIIFYSSLGKRPSDTFSICLICGKLCCIPKVFPNSLNHKHSKNLVAIFLLCFYVLYLFHTQNKSEESFALHPDGVRTFKFY